MEKWVQISRESYSKEFLWEHKKIGYKSPTSGVEIKFDVLECSDWINIIAITKDKKVIMVEQFRSGTNEITLEFPAGGVDSSEDHEKAAIRELSEETGSSVKNLKLIGSSKPNPAFLSNTLWTYLSEDVVIDGTQNLDKTEEVKVVLVPLDKIDSMIQNGEISHSLTITSWCFYKLFLK